MAALKMWQWGIAGLFCGHMGFEKHNFFRYVAQGPLGGLNKLPRGPQNDLLI